MLLSIIIPCYNSARFIANTLDMLLSQGLQNCEVIVVNDGSTDDTADIVREYTQKNAAIQLIDKQNEGVSVARNIGIGVAKSAYIYFLDSDDTLTDGTLDFYREILEANHQKKFFGFGYYSRRNGNLLKNYSAKSFDGKLLDSLLLKQSFFSKKLCFHICSCIYERTFLLENKIKFTQGLRIGEDIEFLLKVLQFAPNCVYNARQCFVYQIRDDSTMQGYKTFSVAHFHSYEVRRNMCFLTEFQDNSIQKYTNFWILNQLVSHLVAYLKSDFCDKEVTNNFIKDLHFFKLPISYKSAFKNLIAILFAKTIPWKLVIENNK